MIFPFFSLFREHNEHDRQMKNAFGGPSSFRRTTRHLRSFSATATDVFLVRGGLTLSELTSSSLSTIKITVKNSLSHPCTRYFQTVHIPGVDASLCTKLCVLNKKCVQMYRTTHGQHFVLSANPFSAKPVFNCCPQTRFQLMSSENVPMKKCRVFHSHELPRLWIFTVV